jgi:hypothetical protein
MTNEIAVNRQMNEVKILEQKFELEQRIAKAMVTSNILPQNFRNIGDVIILNEMSRNLGVPAIQLAQQLYIVKGKVGFSGQFAIALLNKAMELGKIDKWNYETKNGGIRVVAYKDNDTIEGTWIDKNLVAQNGWNSNKHWNSNFDLMARYRSATWFIRLYFPELLMGMQTADEIKDVEISPQTPTPQNITEAEVIDPLELVKNKNVIETEEIKGTEPQTVTKESFGEFYNQLPKDKKVKYMEIVQAVDFNTLNDDQLQSFYAEVKNYVEA